MYRRQIYKLQWLTECSAHFKEINLRPCEISFWIAANKAHPNSTRYVQFFEVRSHRIILSRSIHCNKNSRLRKIHFFRQPLNRAKMSVKKNPKTLWTYLSLFYCDVHHVAFKWYHKFSWVAARCRLLCLWRNRVYSFWFFSEIFRGKRLKLYIYKRSLRGLSYLTVLLS